MLHQSLHGIGPTRADRIIQILSTTKTKAEAKYNGGSGDVGSTEHLERDQRDECVQDGHFQFSCVADLRYVGMGAKQVLYVYAMGNASIIVKPNTP